METYYGAVISTQQQTCHPDESSWAGNQGAGQVGPRQYSQEDLWLQLAVPQEMILWWQVLNVTDPDFMPTLQFHMSHRKDLRLVAVY